jgi:hypothetical protein
MTPEEREALLASYALGTLSAPDVDDAERLIRSDPAAADEVARFQEIAELMALAAPVRQPPPALRDRVMAAAKRSPSKSRRRWHVPVARFLPAASLAAVVAIVSIWAVNLQQELDDLREESALLTAVVEADARRLDQIAAQPNPERDISLLETQLQETQSATSIIVDPEAQSAELVPTDAAHGATGTYTWSDSADAAVLVLRNLRQIGFLEVYRVTLLDRWGNVVATDTLIPDGSETMKLIQTPPGSWPQSVVVFATNQASASHLPDGPVVLEVYGIE